MTRHTTLVVGATGSGKSTTVARLAAERPEMLCLTTDPGNAAFGPPCAISLGVWGKDGWEVLDVEPIGSLDALRFRAVLLVASARLLGRHTVEHLIVDAPGVHRGVGAAELVAGLAELAQVDALLAIGEPDDALELVGGVPVEHVPRVPGARRGGDATRRKRRTRAWTSWLDAAAEEMPLGQLDVFDHHPDAGLEGRIAVLRGKGGPVGLGLVRAGVVTWRRTSDGAPVAVTLRDAALRDGSLRTLPRSAPQLDGDEPEAMEFTLGGKPSVTIGLPMERVASARLSPVGDWFDDPMWLLRLDHRRRCLAFDLGEVRRLPTRIVHEISDVFISHAHLDHVRDFMWFIRKRLGTPDAVRLYGPPGLAQRVHHMIEACTWDRVEDRGPRFEVAELDGATLRWTALQVGEAHAPQALGSEDVEDDVILRDDRFVVRAIELDHHIPVLAFSVQESARFDVRPDVLRERGWKPGKWLGELKTLAARGALQTEIDVPGGGRVAVGELHDLLLLRRRPEKFVYATDLADHPQNRERLIAFARDADVFVCEASFREHDHEQAVRTGHLTARACGEIATAAEVRWLVPFHPSSRYHEDWRELLAEVQAACDRVVGGFRARARHGADR